MRASMPQANRPAPAFSPVAWVCHGFWLAVALALAFAVNLPAQPPAGAPQRVVIKQMHFEPATLNIKAGDRVEWKNEDIFTHTVTANDGSFDSGPIAPGSSWQTTITKSGTTAYHCGPHPNMTAALVVQQAGAQEQQQGERQEGSASSLRWRVPTRPDEIHPILVNFAAALLPLALLSDLLGRILRRQGLHAAGLWLMVYEAAITPLTVIAGWWWKSAQANQLPARLIAVHQWLGTAAALLFVVLAAWRWSFHKRSIPPTWAYLGCVLIALLVLIYQGSIGGAMVFGQ